MQLTFLLLDNATLKNTQGDVPLNKTQCLFQRLSTHTLRILYFTAKQNSKLSVEQLNCITLPVTLTCLPPESIVVAGVRLRDEYAGENW